MHASASFKAASNLASCQRQAERFDRRAALSEGLVSIVSCFQDKMTSYLYGYEL